MDNLYEFSLLEKYEDTNYLNERITGSQLKKLIPGLGFGLEIELEVHEDYENIYKRIYKQYKIKSIPDLLEMFYDDYLDNDISETYFKPLLKLFPLLEKYGKPKFGVYHSTDKELGWRIETDNSLSPAFGVELITPNENNKGITYNQVLEDIPEIIPLLKEIGLYPKKDKTSMHIHLSYKNILNANMFKIYWSFMTNIYSPFSLLCYLSNQENMVLYLKGDIDRAEGMHSINFINSLIKIISFESLNKYFTINENTKLWSTLIDKIKYLKTNILTIPVYQFLLKENFPKEFEFLNLLANQYIGEVFNGSHDNETSARQNTIEIRSFGGEDIFNLISNKNELAKILNDGITQVLPLILGKIPDKKAVFKYTYKTLTDSVESVINLKLAKLRSELTKNPNLDISKELNIAKDHSINSPINNILKSGKLKKIEFTQNIK